MKKVVNAIILDAKSEKVLVIKRREGIHSGKWAFPGGIVEDNETSENALKREIKEELGVKIGKIIKRIGAYEYPRENKEVTKGESFLVSLENMRIKLDSNEISESKWATIEDLESLDCAPGIEEEAMKAVYGNAQN